MPPPASHMGKEPLRGRSKPGVHTVARSSPEVDTVARKQPWAHQLPRVFSLQRAPSLTPRALTTTPLQESGIASAP